MGSKSNRSFFRRQSEQLETSTQSRKQGKRLFSMARMTGRNNRENEKATEVEKSDLISTDDWQPVSTSEDVHDSKASVSQQPPLVSLRVFRNLFGALKNTRYLFSSLFLLTIVVVVVVVFVFRESIYILILRVMQVPPGLYSRNGHLYIGQGNHFHIKGFSWFGMELDKRVPGGLTKTSVDNVMKFANKHDFNAIRLPLSVQNIDENPSITNDFSTFGNPELSSKNYIGVIRHVVEKAADHNILILLDIHRLSNNDHISPGLWYKDDVSEEKLKEAWATLAVEFQDDWNILGADIFNEPWNATWNENSADPTNWRRAAIELGNKIHEMCPSWLIFVEGVGNRAGVVKDGVFWSENLRAMYSIPPEFERNSKAVLSPHVYGPSVYMQDYFKSNNFSDSMPEKWENHFGGANNVTGFAIVIGEWGGKFKNKDEQWQRKFFQYLMDKGLSFFYWCINPDSEDTGGLLKEDWKTPEHEKLVLLEDAPSSEVEQYKVHFQKFRSWA